MDKNKNDKEFSAKETKQRFDAMLKGALKSPPKPLKDIKTATQKRKALKTAKAESRK